jgi:hypothetical protein
MAHYAHLEEGMHVVSFSRVLRRLIIRFENLTVQVFLFHFISGDIVTVRNVLSEQEAYGIQSLAKCMKSLLPNKKPFYKDRLFGKDQYREGDDEAELSLYSGFGGNMCTFMQGTNVLLWLVHIFFLQDIMELIFVAIYEQA